VAGISTSELTFLVNQQLPRPLRISDETMRKWEHGMMPKMGANPAVMAAIAVALDVPIADLDPEVEGQLAQIRVIHERVKGSAKSRRSTKPKGPSGA